MIRFYNISQKRYLFIDKNLLNRAVALPELSTGLYDINGKEIFEGDIVKEGVVEHNFSSWTIDGQPMLQYNNYYEIIGNIHEKEEK